MLHGFNGILMTLPREFMLNLLIFERTLSSISLYTMSFVEGKYTYNGQQYDTTARPEGALYEKCREEIAKAMNESEGTMQDKELHLRWCVEWGRWSWPKQYLRRIRLLLPFLTYVNRDKYTWVSASSARSSSLSSTTTVSP